MQTLNQFSIKSYPLASALRKAKFSSDEAMLIKEVKSGEERLIRTLLLFKAMEKLPDYRNIRGSDMEQYQEDLVSAELKYLQRKCVNFVSDFRESFDWDREKAVKILNKIAGLEKYVSKAISIIDEDQNGVDSLYIGVDAGGTSSRAVIGDHSGKILGIGKGGPSFPLACGLERSIDNVIGAIRDACKDAGINPETTKFRRLCIGTAGIDTFKDHTDYLQSLIEDAKYRWKMHFKDVFVIQDGLLAWFSAFNGNPGIIVNGGTGDLIFGYNDSNDANNNMKELWTDWTRIIRLGGRMIGYHGALKVLSLLNEGKETKMTKMWEEAFDKGEIYSKYMGTKNFLEVLSYVEESAVTNTKLTITEVAEATNLAYLAAKAGDKDAVEIINEAVDSSAKYVHRVAKWIGLAGKTFDVAVVGSVIKDPYSMDLFVEKLKSYESGARIIPNHLKPEYGAYEIARRNVRFY